MLPVHKLIPTLIQLGGVCQVLFWASVGLVKISITLFNRRLTGLTSGWWIIYHNTLLALLVCYVLVATFLNLFQCRPATTNYSLIEIGQLPNKPTCLDESTLGISLSIAHIIFDFALLSVPIIVLIKVQMDAAKKFRLAILFSIGSVSCIGSVMRQILVSRVPIDVFCKSDDFAILNCRANLPLLTWI